MKVYFVRHGQSIFNLGTTGTKTHQFPDTPLGPEGIKQAQAVARRFTNISIEAIISSTYTRALQTAKEIEKVKQVPLIQSELFIERKLPSLFWGKLIDSPEIASIHQQIRDNTDDPTWHHSDEENFADQIVRAKKAFRFLETQDYDEFVVVTHGYYLMLLITLILFGDNTTPAIARSFRDHSSYSNTGLTMCEYKNAEWRLLTFNDYAHLGE